jgi:hypothetical protein
MELFHTEQRRDQVFFLASSLRCNTRKVINAILLNKAKSVGLWIGRDCDRLALRASPGQ